MNTGTVEKINSSESMAAMGPPAPHMHETPCHLKNTTRKKYPSMLPAMNPSGVAGISPRTKILNTSENSDPFIHPLVFPVIYFHTTPQGFL